MKVRIGITSGWEPGILVEGWPAVYINKGLVEKIENAGGIPIIIPVLEKIEIIDEYMTMIDGIIIAGEIMSIKHNTEQNGGENALYNGNPLRYKNEEKVIKSAISRNIPLLGICRGHQMINVVEGGTLKQEDITLNNSVMHQQAGLLSPEKSAHNISIIQDSVLSQMLGTGVIQVNSFHRQAVEDVPKGYSVSAVASDGNIEAIENKGKSLVIGMQFHPEMMSGEKWDMFFKNFIHIVQTNKNRK